MLSFKSRKFTARRIAVLYFGTLIFFAFAFFSLPEGDFYHASIAHEPASRVHLERFKSSLSRDLGINTFESTRPDAFSVGSSEPYNLFFSSEAVTFDISYYYYKFGDWPQSESKCGKSERPSPLYRRTIELRVTLLAAMSRDITTVLAKMPAPLSACDREALELLYHSLEITPSGFQARVKTSHDTADLLIPVADEQESIAPRYFRFDRAVRMLYLSITVITTTGFGDIIPLTSLARFLTGLESLVGIVLAGTFLNAIASRPNHP